MAWYDWCGPTKHANIHVWSYNHESQSSVSGSSVEQPWKVIVWGLVRCDRFEEMDRQAVWRNSVHTVDLGTLTSEDAI